MVVETGVPKRIGRLSELAVNLWWSWHEQARTVFRALDYPLWRLSGHNPVKQLSQMNPYVLEDAAIDPAFLKLYDTAMSYLDNDLSTTGTWYHAHHPHLLDAGPVAYFSMEYAFHHSLAIYAGGLGVLAGDVCKVTSDLGIPFVAVGFMYPQGYFHQHVAADGWQQEIYQQVDFRYAPIKRVMLPGGRPAIASVKLADVTLAIGVWQVRLGRTNVYLLDTNLEENPPEYRNLSARLYIADREVRIQQEIVLGIGGVRVLRALGIQPAIWHANEGHNSFMMLERLREKVAAGRTFAEAEKEVKATTVFTTHTPVGAGHDVFSEDLLRKYLDFFRQRLGVDWADLFRLGEDPSGFNMTALAMRLSEKRTAVSELHEKVSKKMWNHLWPDLPEEKVPITYVTNGVHVPTWMAPELYDFLSEYCGHSWHKALDGISLRDRLLEIPDNRLWAVHQKLKAKLLTTVRDRMRERWIDDKVPLQQVLAMGALLSTNVLTIAFARRFAEYKRPALIFRDKERLKNILNNREFPVQIIFAGKSHPADFQSKCLLQQVYTLATQHEFQGRIVFVEDYDTHLARYLVQGVDLWLNHPRRLYEASGTSGMKASLNGVPQFSVLDGWWREGYNGDNGWAIGKWETSATSEEEDRTDAESIYQLLEQEIVPLYYKRERDGVPRAWIRRVKETIASSMPDFCAERMAKQYVDFLYAPIIKSLHAAQRRS